MTATRMTADEVLAEVDWLLNSGLHPDHIAKQIGRSLVAIETMARHHNRPDISRIFNRVIKKVA
jgi:hypothetical protein